MPSIINLEEENPKFDIWSSDSIVMFGKIEPWSVSQFRDLRKSSNPVGLKLGSNAQTLGSL